MKKAKFIIAGFVLLAIAAFQSCNCDEAVNKEKAACDSRLTAAKDSLQGVAKAEMDAAKATYEAQIMGLSDSLAAKTAALEAATKKTGTTKKSTTTTTTTPKKEEEPKKEPGKINIGKKGGQ